MVALTSLVEKHVTLAVGPCCVKNLDPAREQHISAAGSLGYVTEYHHTASLSPSGPKGAYVVVCEYTPSPSDDVKELV